MITQINDRIKVLQERIASRDPQEEGKETVRSISGNTIVRRTVDPSRELVRIQNNLDQANKLYFTFLISPQIDNHIFIEKAEALIKKDSRYSLTINDSEELNIEGVKISLHKDSI
jgi:hypothetical protein